MKFCDELNKYLELLSYSAKELSEETGLSPTIISRYLNDKRTPRLQSEQFDKIVSGLYKLAYKRNINLSKDDIVETLGKSISYEDINFDNFVDNFNTLLVELKINISDIANSVDYDVSFISRIKNKTRKPSDLDNFAEKFTDFIIENYKINEDKKLIASLINCSMEDLENNSSYKKLLLNWINSSQITHSELVKSFLSGLDNFSLNDYIGTDFNKIKVPTSPVILRSSKTYYGKGR